MKSHLIITALLAFCSTARAMIGDGPEQIAAHYGKPKQVIEERGNYREVGYVFGELAVLVKFIGGVSQKEGFARFDKAPFSTDAIQQILKVSAPKSVSWNEVKPEDDSDHTWKRSDGKAKALLLHRDFLVVQDINYVAPK